MNAGKSIFDIKIHSQFTDSTVRLYKLFISDIGCWISEVKNFLI
jgi:hypothetical protein